MLLALQFMLSIDSHHHVKVIVHYENSYSTENLPMSCLNHLVAFAIHSFVPTININFNQGQLRVFFWVMLQMPKAISVLIPNPTNSTLHVMSTLLSLSSPLTKILIPSLSNLCHLLGFKQIFFFFHECPLLPIFGSGPTSPSILGPILSSSPQISPFLPFESIISNTESVTSTTIVPDPSPSQPMHSNPPPPVAPQTSQHPMQTHAKFGIFKPKRAHNTTTVDYLKTKPPNFKITLQYPQWHEAMTSEFQALQRQATWTLVPPSQTHNLVGCPWVYKLK